MSAAPGLAEDTHPGRGQVSKQRRVLVEEIQVGFLSGVDQLSGEEMKRFVSEVGYRLRVCQQRNCYQQRNNPERTRRSPMPGIFIQQSMAAGTSLKISLLGASSCVAEPRTALSARGATGSCRKAVCRLSCRRSDN